VTWRDQEEHAYPSDKDVRARMMPMPVARPEREADEPMTALRRDGTPCDIRRSLGLDSAPAPDEDNGVVWEQVVP
jgi:hypothetical protein